MEKKTTPAGETIFGYIPIPWAVFPDLGCQEKLALQEQIRENICYDVLLTLRPKEQVDAVVNVMADNLAAGETLNAAGREIPPAEFRTRLLQLDDMDICYVLDCIKREKRPIRNLRGYILARLCDAKDQQDLFYEDWTRSDEYAEEKKHG